MAGHTPGPWATDGFDPRIIVAPSGSSLGEMTAGDPYISLPVQRDNARLAAAAPTLLEAVIAAEDILDDFLDLDPGAEPDTEHEAVLHKLRAAIAAATGEGE